MYSLSFHAIDSWSTSLGPHDTFQILFDSLSPINCGPFEGDLEFNQDICAHPTAKDSGNLKMIGWISHSSLSLTLRFNLQLNQNSLDESLGIRDIQLNFTNTTFSSNYNCIFYTLPTFSQTRCTCPQNQFDFQTFQCNTCHSPLCSSCIDSGANSCSECSQGYYLPIVPGTCTNCDPICPTCFGPGTGNCNSCVSGYYLGGTSCNGCDPICPTCSGTGINNCNSCIQGYYLDGTTCKICDPICPTCFGTGTNNCNSCIQGYYLDGVSCRSCHTSCFDCNSFQYNQCTACLPGFILFRGVCIEINRCIPPFNNVNNFECHSPCPNQNFSSWRLNCFPKCLTTVIPGTDALCKSKL